MFTSTLLTALLAFSASALPTIPLSERDSSTNSGLIERDNWSDTRNDLIDGGCKPVTVIFARGTIELGNVGTLAGPPFFNALTDMIGDSNVAVQGVDYAASIEGYLEGGDPEGASTMASLINQAISQCPSTQIVISGYRYVAFLHLMSLVLTYFAAKELRWHISRLNRSQRTQQRISQQLSSSATQMMDNHCKTLHQTRI